MLIGPWRAHRSPGFLAARAGGMCASVGRTRTLVQWAAFAREAAHAGPTGNEKHTQLLQLSAVVVVVVVLLHIYECRARTLFCKKCGVVDLVRVQHFPAPTET